MIYSLLINYSWVLLSSKKKKATTTELHENTLKTLPLLASVSKIQPVRVLCSESVNSFSQIICLQIEWGKEVQPTKVLFRVCHLLHRFSHTSVFQTPVFSDSWEDLDLLQARWKDVTSSNHASGAVSLEVPITDCKLKSGPGSGLNRRLETYQLDSAFSVFK